MPSDNTDLTLNLLRLVQDALGDFQRKPYVLEHIIRKGIRVATLSRDYESLTALELESADMDNKVALEAIFDRLKPHHNAIDLQALRNRVMSAYIEERRADFTNLRRRQLGQDAQIRTESIAAIEQMHSIVIKQLNEARNAAVPPFATYDPPDRRRERVELIEDLEAGLQDYRLIHGRIEHNVYRVLVNMEAKLYGVVNSDIFEQNRRYVDEKLTTTIPNALNAFVSVYHRMSEGDAEARSQVLTSCRRIIKAVADALQPPTKETITGPDGNLVPLNDANYRARLRKYIMDHSEHENARYLLLAQVNDLGERISRLDNIGSKGVHAEVSPFEMNQCVIQTYLTVGDILRLSEGESSAGS